MRRNLAALALTPFLVAGCAILPGDPEELLESSFIVAALQVEQGAAIEVARFSRASAGGRIPDQWQPYTVFPGTPPTQYRLVSTGEGVALEANADKSASGMYRRIRIDPKHHPVVEWRWNVAQAVQGADLRVPSLEDSPARLVISFHGDVTQLDFTERFTLRLYRAVSGQRLPFAMLMYIWSSEHPVDSIFVSQHSEKIQMIVVDGSPPRLGQWSALRRNVLEDYRRAFGGEPWDIVAVGVMTDSDHTGESARAWYGDITFRGGK